MKRISVVEAGKKLGISPDTIRKEMLSGRLPIGKCLGTEKRTIFLIYEELIDKYIQSAV